MQEYKNKKILITGASGYIGSALVERLKQTDCRLVLLSNEKMDVKGKNIKTIVGDVAKRKVWKKVLRGVDVVFHLAAFEHRRGSEFNPTLDARVNTLSVLHLLETCRSVKQPPRIVFSSSSNLAGLVSQLPVNEDVADNPLTMYAVNKMAAERYLEYYFNEYGLPSVTLRLANVYGPSPSKAGTDRITMNRIIAKAAAGGPLALFKNKDRVRDYIYIDDVVSAFLAAGAGKECARGRYYIVGSGEGISFAQAMETIAERAAEKIDKKPQINLDPNAPIEPVEQRDFTADYSRFKKDAGWSPATRFADGVKKTIEYFLQQ